MNSRATHIGCTALAQRLGGTQRINHTLLLGYKENTSFGPFCVERIEQINISKKLLTGKINSR